MVSWAINEKKYKPLKNIFTLIVATSVTLSGLLYRESLKYRSGFDQKLPFVARQDTTNYKRILLWTEIAGQSYSFSPTNQPDWLDGCPESRCLFVTSRLRPNKADAVIFCMSDFLDVNDKPDESSRRTDQYYVFYHEESPDTTKAFFPWRTWNASDNFFNLTMSYRRDSDIPSDIYLAGYQSHIVNLTTRDPLWFEGKRDILIMVSHCKTASKREDYVRKLSQYIKVDQYGKCDTPDPCKLKNETDCDMGNLLGRYKFYLSFENSICTDYVTEKLTRALNADVVPVVLGGANYSAIFPKDAVINTEDFVSPKLLAKYLLRLLENSTMYERHLAWKYPGQSLWRIPGHSDRKDSRFCKLCEILHRPPETRIRKSYASVQQWWFDGQCREPYKIA